MLTVSTLFFPGQRHRHAHTLADLAPSRREEVVDVRLHSCELLTLLFVEPGDRRPVRLDLLEPNLEIAFSALGRAELSADVLRRFIGTG